MENWETDASLESHSSFKHDDPLAASILFQKGSLALISQEGHIEFYPEIGKDPSHYVAKVTNYSRAEEHMAQSISVEFGPRELLTYFPQLQTICVLDFSEQDYSYREIVDEKAFRITKPNRETEELISSDFHYNKRLGCVFLIQGMYKTTDDFIEHSLFRCRLGPPNTKPKFTRVCQIEGAVRPFIHSSELGFAFGMLKFNEIHIRVELPDRGAMEFSISATHRVLGMPQSPQIKRIFNGVGLVLIDSRLFLMVIFVNDVLQSGVIFKDLTNCKGVPLESQCEVQLLVPFGEIEGQNYDGVSEEPLYMLDLENLRTSRSMINDDENVHQEGLNLLVTGQFFVQNAHRFLHFYDCNLAKYTFVAKSRPDGSPELRFEFSSKPIHIESEHLIDGSKTRAIEMVRQKDKSGETILLFRLKNTIPKDKIYFWLLWNLCVKNRKEPLFRETELRQFSLNLE